MAIITIKTAVLPVSPTTSGPCPHCKAKDTHQGTHGGCIGCGRVKHTRSGRIESAEAK